MKNIEFKLRKESGNTYVNSKSLKYSLYISSEESICIKDLMNLFSMSLVEVALFLKEYNLYYGQERLTIYFYDKDTAESLLNKLNILIKCV